MLSAASRRVRTRATSLSLKGNLKVLMNLLGHDRASVAFSVLCSFALTTACWVLCGLMTSGDSFANGSPVATLGLIASAIIGFLIGYKVRDTRFRVAVVVAVLASLCFWFLAREGWWKHGPATQDMIQIARGRSNIAGLGMLLLARFRGSADISLS
jgi:hypothetical protein